MSVSAPAPGQRLERMRDVLARTGLSRSTLYSLLKGGQFPRPVSVTGSRRIAFVSSEVDAWVQARIQDRDAEAA